MMSSLVSFSGIYLLVAICSPTVFSTAYLENGTDYTQRKASPECMASINLAMASIKKELWAVKMIDAFGKPEDSMLEGNLRWTGEYDECRQIKVPAIPVMNMPSFKGKYCWLTWTCFMFETPFPLQSGGCVPSTCSESDALAAYPYVIDTLGFDRKQASGVIRLDEITCLPDENPMTPTAFFTLFLLLLFTGLVCGISFYDYWEMVLHEPDDEEEEEEELLLVNGNGEELHKKTDDEEVKIHDWKDKLRESEGRIKRLLMCFSMVRNASTLTEPEPSNSQLAFINGLRVLSFFPILIIHSEHCQLTIDRAVLKHRDYAQSLPFQFVFTGHYSVETFFYLSGFFFAYCFLRNGNVTQITGRRFLILAAYRYMRTSIPMLAVLIIQGVLMNYAGDGPIWDIQEQSVSKCPKLWWTFLFNIQNFYTEIRQCCGWLWYVALDFQFFLVALGLLFFFQRSTRTGVLVTTALILVSTITTILISYKHQLSTYQGYLIWKEFNASYFQEELTTFFREIYNQPYCRIGTYLVGLLYGIHAFKNNGSKNKTEQHDALLYAGWMASAFCFLGVIVICYFFDFGDFGSAVYHAVARYFWCAGLIWICYVCMNGFGGTVGNILASEFWTTMGRLTFSAYLVHMIWLQYLFFTERQFSDYNSLNLGMLELGSFALSYMFAFFFHLLFEAPFSRLGKLIFFPASSQKSKLTH